MKKIIIAMTNKLQSEKLAIALSHSFDSTIVSSSQKLKNLLKHSDSDYYTIIFEENKSSCDFSKEITTYRKKSKSNLLSIRITAANNDAPSNDFSLILKKPFGTKELHSALDSLMDKPRSTAAIA